ncbi:MAG: DUF3298 domain-containing protein [Sphingobacteriaceae bacterium]
MRNKLKYLFTALVCSCLVNNVKAIDTLSYQYKTLKKASRPLITADKDTIISTIELSYPVFKTPLWNEQVKQLIFNNEVEKPSFETYNDYLDGFIKASVEANAEEGDYPRSWYQEINVRVEPQFAGTQTISLSLNTTNYTGGAHPNSSLIFVNYDLFSKKLITLSNLINPVMMTRLTYIGSTIFRKQEGLSPTQSLENYFFENQKFALNSNFLITKNGLLFYYNPYEIRSYAEGPMELLIPYSAIGALLKINPYLPKNHNK